MSSLLANPELVGRDIFGEESLSESRIVASLVLSQP
jgi:hypothetical protein